MYAVLREISDDGVLRLLLEHMAQVPLAHAEVLGNLGYVYGALGIVLRDIFHRFEHVAALVALGKRQLIGDAQAAFLLLLAVDALDSGDKLLILKGCYDEADEVMRQALVMTGNNLLDASALDFIPIEITHR